MSYSIFKWFHPKIFLLLLCETLYLWVSIKLFLFINAIVRTFCKWKDSYILNCLFATTVALLLSSNEIRANQPVMYFLFPIVSFWFWRFFFLLLAHVWKRDINRSPDSLINVTVVCSFIKCTSEVSPEGARLNVNSQKGAIRLQVTPLIRACPHRG